MARLYQYALLKQDDTLEELLPSRKKDFKEICKILGCQMIELIPRDYYSKKGFDRCEMYGDEEARFNENNKRNPHFTVLIDPVDGSEWDIVGNILMEKAL